MATQEHLRPTGAPLLFIALSPVSLNGPYLPMPYLMHAARPLITFASVNIYPLRNTHVFDTFDLSFMHICTLQNPEISDASFLHGMT